MMLLWPAVCPLLYNHSFYPRLLRPPYLSFSPSCLPPLLKSLLIDGAGWRWSALVHYSLSPLTSSYRRNSGRIRKMKRFKGSAGHFVSSSHSLESSRSAVKSVWEPHGDWRHVTGHWCGSLKEQFSHYSISTKHAWRISRNSRNSHQLLLGSNKTSECEWMFGCGLVAAMGPDVAHCHQYECRMNDGSPWVSRYKSKPG